MSYYLADVRILYGVSIRDQAIALGVSVQHLADGNDQYQDRLCLARLAIERLGWPLVAVRLQLCCRPHYGNYAATLAELAFSPTWRDAAERADARRRAGLAPDAEHGWRVGGT